MHQRTLKGYVCVRLNVSLGSDGRPDDEAVKSLWKQGGLKGVPSVAVLSRSGTLVAAENDPDSDELQAILAKGLAGTSK